MLCWRILRYAYFECNAVRIYESEQKLGGATPTFHVKYFFAVRRTVFEGIGRFKCKVNLNCI
jgi:hypothetical protein